MTYHKIDIRQTLDALLTLREAFVVAVGDKSPFAKEALRLADEVLVRPVIAEVPGVKDDFHEDRISILLAALEWYADKAENCRKFGAAGDQAREALDKDGGQRARAALSATKGERNG